MAEHRDDNDADGGVIDDEAGLLNSYRRGFTAQVLGWLESARSPRDDTPPPSCYGESYLEWGRSPAETLPPIYADELRNISRIVSGCNDDADDARAGLELKGFFWQRIYMEHPRQGPFDHLMAHLLASTLELVSWVDIVRHYRYGIELPAELASIRDQDVIEEDDDD